MLYADVYCVRPINGKVNKKLICRVNVSHANLTSSTALRIYGDDEDWPYLSGDVDEEAVRLAASLEPDTTEEAKDGPQQDPRKKQNATEKMADKWNSQQYCNSDGSSHCGKTSDKLDGIWSLHLWKSMYSTSIRQLCYFRQHIGKMLQDYMCSLIPFSDAILLNFAAVIMKTREMLLQLLFTADTQVGSNGNVMGLFLKTPADEAED